MELVDCLEEEGSTRHGDVNAMVAATLNARGAVHKIETCVLLPLKRRRKPENEWRK